MCCRCKLFQDLLHGFKKVIPEFVKDVIVVRFCIFTTGQSLSG